MCIGGLHAGSCCHELYILHVNGVGLQYVRNVHLKPCAELKPALRLVSRRRLPLQWLTFGCTRGGRFPSKLKCAGTTFWELWSGVCRLLLRGTPQSHDDGPLRPATARPQTSSVCPDWREPSKLNACKRTLARRRGNDSTPSPCNRAETCKASSLGSSNLADFSNYAADQVAAKCSPYIHPNPRWSVGVQARMQPGR